MFFLLGVGSKFVKNGFKLGILQHFEFFLFWKTQKAEGAREPRKHTPILKK